jgi:hypothetical protein
LVIQCGWIVFYQGWTKSTQRKLTKKLRIENKIECAKYGFYKGVLYLFRSIKKQQLQSW